MEASVSTPFYGYSKLWLHGSEESRNRCVKVTEDQTGDLLLRKPRTSQLSHNCSHIIETLVYLDPFRFHQILDPLSHFPLVSPVKGLSQSNLLLQISWKSYGGGFGTKLGNGSYSKGNWSYLKVREWYLEGNELSL